MVIIKMKLIFNLGMITITIIMMIDIKINKKLISFNIIYQLK